jgi:hypothetical protein
MKKYFHELTREEIAEIQAGPSTSNAQVAKDYPQPEWCTYPNATYGILGCWGLMRGSVHDNKSYCAECECNKEVTK